MKNLLIPLALLLLACGSAEEAPKVSATVRTSDAGLAPLATDLGYEVELIEARALLQDLRFYAPESTAGLDLQQILFPRAWAHPGHHHGGELIGELRGRFVVDWLEGGELGVATLLAGRYVSAAYDFAIAKEEDGVAADDPLLGHAAMLRGRARRGSEEVAFTVLVDSARQVEGIPFEARIDAEDEPRLELHLLAKSGGLSLFDTVDFLDLAEGSNEALVLSSAAVDEEGLRAHGFVQRALFRHRFHEVRAAPGAL